MKRLSWTFVVILAALTAQIAAHPLHKEMMNIMLQDTPKEAFKLWHYVHEKTYDLNSETGINRYRIFKRNLKFIKQRNEEQSSYTLGLGPLSDLSDDEFMQIYGGGQLGFQKEYNNDEIDNLNDDEVEEIEHADEELGAEDPDLIKDWRSKLPESIIRNATGSCYPTVTIAALQAMESQMIILKKKDMIKLSLQEVIDCYKDNMGCSGSTLDSAYFYARDKMISSDQDYPMESEQTECKRFKCEGTSNSLKPVWQPGSAKTCYYFSESQKCTEATITEFIKKSPYATYLPIIPEMKLYTGGVLDVSCSLGNVRSSTLVVAYGPNHVVITFHAGTKYGLNGYIKVKTDKCKVFIESAVQPLGGAFRR